MNEDPTPHPEVGPIKQFYRDLVTNLTEPRRFYEERYPELSFNHAVAYGLVVCWIAEVILWFTRMVNNESLLDGFLRVRDQLMQLPLWKDLPTSMWAQNRPDVTSIMPAWLAEASTVALFPFSYLIKIVFSAAALAVGAWIFIQKRPPEQTPPSDPVQIGSFIKLAATASTPALVGSILNFLPLGMGSFVGGLYSFVLLLFAISTRYRVSMLRAFAVWLTPWVALGLVGACFIGIFGAMIVAFIASIFGAGV